MVCSYIILIFGHGNISIFSKIRIFLGMSKLYPDIWKVNCTLPQHTIPEIPHENTKLQKCLTSWPRITQRFIRRLDEEENQFTNFNLVGRGVDHSTYTRLVHLRLVWYIANLVYIWYFN